MHVDFYEHYTFKYLKAILICYRKCYMIQILVFSLAWYKQRVSLLQAKIFICINKKVGLRK